MNRVIVEVRGGVAEVTGCTGNVEVLMVDWDNIKAGDPLPDSETVRIDSYDQFEAKLVSIRDEAKQYQEAT